MSKKSVICFCSIYCLVIISTLINGFQKLDSIVIILMMLSILAVVYNYFKRKEKAKTDEEILRIMRENLVLIQKAALKEDNIQVDCASFANSKYLFCTIHPNNKNCLDCPDYKVINKK